MGEPTARRPVLILGLVAASIFAVTDLVAQRGTPVWALSESPVIMGAGEEELFQLVGFGRILLSGRAVVVDPGQRFARIYDREGARVAQLGGPGSGPGEFGSINGLALLPGDRIGLWDSSARRLSVFDSRGSYLRSRRIGANGNLPPGNLHPFLGTFRNGDVLLAAMRFGERKSGDEIVPERWNLLRFAGGGELSGSLGEINGMWRMPRFPLPFTPVPRVVVDGDSVVMAHPLKAEIIVLNDRGRDARPINIPHLVAYSRGYAGARRTLRATLEERGSAFFLELLRNVPAMRNLPMISVLLIDPDRRHLWIKSYDPATDAVWLRSDALHSPPGGNWQVVGFDGSPVASIQIPKHLTVLDVRGGSLLAIARNALDVERVELYSIVR